MSPRIRILSIASDLFYANGIAAVGVDRIIAAAGVAKATFYRHFPSKDELIVAYLKDRHDQILTQLGEALAAFDNLEPPAPLDRILRIFEILQQKATRPPFRGCAFLIAVSESEGLPAILEIARLHKRALRALFAESAAALSDTPALLTDQIALCYEGALAMIAVNRDPGAVDIARAAVLDLVSLHTGRLQTGRLQTGHRPTP